MDTDFSQLYAWLGLSPQASVDELKRAYRRRVGQLHPDRQPTAGASPEAREHFTQLISMYSQAMRFHREHGRLPGSVAEKTAAPRPVAGAGLSGVPARPAREHVPADHRLWALLVAVGALAAGASLWTPQAPLADLQPSVVVAPPQPAMDSAPAARSVLELGMSPARVRSIQGPPTSQRDEVWEYGPSWLRFEKGRLVEWYSSPLYRLKVSTPIGLQEAGAPP